MHPLTADPKKAVSHPLEDRNSLFSRLLLESKKMSIVAGKELLYQAYDLSFGIHDYIKQRYNEDHSNDLTKNRPLSSVALHPAEDISGPDSRFGHIAKAFIEFKMATSLGYNLTEFLDLPVEYVELLVRIARKNHELDYRANNEGIQNLNMETKK